MSDESISPASRWERTILKGLELCDWLLLFMTPRSAVSEWVKDELNWMIENKQDCVVPLLIEDCNPIDFHIRLARIQYVDCREDLATGLESVLRRVRGK